MAAGYYHAASGIGRSALADEIGATGLPMAYALALACIGLLMALQAILRRILGCAQAEPRIELSELIFMLHRAGGVLGIGISYLLIVTTVGYVIALIMVLAAMLVYLGERPSVRVALVSIGVCDNGKSKALLWNPKACFDKEFQWFWVEIGWRPLSP